MDGFARRLLDWHARHGRHDLPWQHPRSPYRVWISEVMLQQTRVATVIGYFERFVTALPDLAALAAAEQDRVLALWSGLGYYRRARHLHAAAQVCMTRHGGRLPHDFAALMALPGIGRSTAAAILALGDGQRHAILDGNVKRVLARFHGIRGWPGDAAVEKRLWTHAEKHTPTTRLADYTQAIMDLGATVCTRSNPRCDACPQARACVARRAGLTVELPTARPRRTLMEKRIILILLCDPRGRVLLQRRPPQGVWPGLWSLPEANDEPAARELARRLARLGSDLPTSMPDIRHGFTHFKLRATPLVWHDAQARSAIADAPESRWCPRAELDTLGIPAPVTKLLKTTQTGASRTPRQQPDHT